MLNRSGQLDLLFQALSDPTRRAVVDRLSRGPASVSDLAKLPGVMQHLQVLEASGLAHSLKIGRVRSCRLEPGALAWVERWIGQRRSTCEHRFSRLGKPARGEAGRR